MGVAFHGDGVLGFLFRASISLLLLDGYTLTTVERRTHVDGNDLADGRVEVRHSFGDKDGVPRGIEGYGILERALMYLLICSSAQQSKIQDG